MCNGLRAVLRLCSAALAVACWLGPARGAEAPAGETVALSAADAAITVRRDTGAVTSLRVGEAGEEMARPHPNGGERPYAFVEVVDLRDGRTYSPLTGASTIADFRLAGGAGGKVLTFVQQYAGAPFRLAHALRETAAGIRWEASLRLAKGQTLNRSVQVNWTLPLPYGWRFWGPNDTTSHRTDGVTPYRYVYGHVDPTPFGTIIPLAGAWGRSGGAAIFSPPDVHKTQISFDVYTQTISDMAHGASRKRGDLQMLRAAHHLVGLRPGKALTLAVCIAGVRPDWRAVLGHYVKSYPELFEPIPAARKYEGMYGISGAGRLQRGGLARMKDRGVTCLEIHAHFPEYGVFITPEALKDPQLTWGFRSNRRGRRSLAANRALIAEALALGVGPFPYFYNVHASPQTARRRFGADRMIDENGKPIIQYQGEPGLRAIPESGFGKHLIEQMDLMLRAYPKAPGFFVDNFSIQWLSFAHDDGVSMVHDRPAYDMNRNHQVVGGICFAKAHKAGKVIMVNKLATIESARGVDMVLVENMPLEALKMTAFACVYRAFFPLSWTYPRSRHSLERCMQYLLLYGGTPAATLYRRDRHTLRAYRRLTDAMIGKRWVFDPNPLRVPGGYDGQVFRIDPHAPHGGSVVVSLVNLKASWRDKKYTEGLRVRLRLPENDQLRKAAWTAPSLKADQAPRPCEIVRVGRTLQVLLPPVGAAGVLRLSR